MRPRMKSKTRLVYQPRFNSVKCPRNLVEAPQWAVNADDSLPCYVCGWPLGVADGSPFYAGMSDEGTKLFKHYACPSLRERAELRKQALVNA